MKHVLIVGGGFAGLACARKLVKHAHIHVTLIDKNNYHQFIPLLYQLATAEIGQGDIAFPLRKYFEGKPNIDVKMAAVTAVDPHSCKISTAEGESYQGDYLVLAAGSQPNFFGNQNIAKNAFPLYSLNDADRLRSRVIAVFEAADRNRELIKQGALNFVVVGAGPTGVELAGALADIFSQEFLKEYAPEIVKEAKIYLIDHVKVVLGPFSENSQQYAAKKLQERGVILKLGLLVEDVTESQVVLSDGTAIKSRTVVWAGGLKASNLSLNSGLKVGHGERVEVLPDLSVTGFPNVFALGDFANIPASQNKYYPQLASVAQQSGFWTAQNIINAIEGKPLKSFEYDDKGIMAMIGRSAAVVEIGEKRHELKGTLAFATWLGVHAMLMPGVKQKINAFIEWGLNYFTGSRDYQILDQNSSADIHWDK